MKAEGRRLAPFDPAEVARAASRDRNAALAAMLRQIGRRLGAARMAQTYRAGQKWRIRSTTNT
jgi:hypothetical protein